MDEDFNGYLLAARDRAPGLARLPRVRDFLRDARTDAEAGRFPDDWGGVELLLLSRGACAAAVGAAARLHAAYAEGAGR